MRGFGILMYKVVMNLLRFILLLTSMFFLRSFGAFVCTFRIGGIVVKACRMT
jgi:hypothetical protein